MDLEQVRSALKLYWADTEVYPSDGGHSFSVWDNNETKHDWRGNWSPEGPLYTTLVLGNYISKLPLDPVNREGGGGNFLDDNSPTDLGYVHTAPNNQCYILGTNLEVGGGPNHQLGNYILSEGC